MWGKGAPFSQVTASKWREPETEMSPSLSPPTPHQALLGRHQGGLGGMGRKCLSFSLRLGLQVLWKVTEPCGPHHSGALTAALLGRCGVV